MIIILRKRNGTKISVTIDKAALKQFREAWQYAHKGIGRELVVYGASGSPLLRLSVADIRNNYHQMIQVK